MRIALFRARVFRFLLTFAFVWVICGPCAYALNGSPDIDKPTLREWVQTSSLSLLSESQQVIKSVVLHTLFDAGLALLPELELATSLALFIGAAERNPFYLLPTIHAP